MIIKNTNFMKQYYYVIVVLFSISFSLLSCSKDDDSDGNDNNNVDPVANFTINGGNKPAPHKVILNNTSTGATSYSWEFGDGGTSVATNPEYIYQQGGTYTISLTAKNGAKQNVITKTITILNRPTKVKMTKLTLTDFPETDNGTGWDTNSPPDVLFEIQNSSGAVLFSSGYKIDLLISQLPTSYSTGLPYTFTSLSTTYYIRFYDFDDLSSNDFMGGYYFTLDSWVPDDGSGYPTELFFESASSQLKFKLTVEWIN
jgi:PKD repeat protein